MLVRAPGLAPVLARGTESAYPPSTDQGRVLASCCPRRIRQEVLQPTQRRGLGARCLALSTCASVVSWAAFRSTRDANKRQQDPLPCANRRRHAAKDVKREVRCASAGCSLTTQPLRRFFTVSSSPRSITVSLDRWLSNVNMRYPFSGRQHFVINGDERAADSDLRITPVLSI